MRTGDTLVSTVRTYLKAIWFAKETNGELPFAPRDSRS